MFKCENCDKELPTLLGKEFHKRTCAISNDALEKIKILYCLNGKSVKEIWKEINVPQQQIRIIIRKNNLKKKNIKQKLTQERKNHLRQKRFEFLSKKSGKTPWERRQAREMSTLEEWFYDEIIIKENMNEKFHISYDYPVFPYFIDFAFHELKLAVELDGPHHFLGEDRIQHDKKKNDNLISQGWSIYRIRFDECNEEGKKRFLEILQTTPEKLRINESEFNLDRFNLSKKKKKVVRSRSEYHQDERNNAYVEIHEPRIKKIRELAKDFDFTKSGWVCELASKLDMPAQKLRGWMKKWVPDLLENAHSRKNSCKVLEKSVD